MTRLETRRLFAAATAAAMLLGSGVSGAEVGRVTGIDGDVSVMGADGLLSANSMLSENDKVETGEDGKVAMLVGNDLLVELCPSSAAVVQEERDGRRIVRVDAGNARIVVQPGQHVPIEIHTPAAIATILGTVIYVTVDPETGETTITSSDHDVDVRGIGPAAAPPVRITGGERTTIDSGGEPAVPRKLGASSMQNLGQCLGSFDRRLRTLAVVRERAARENSAVTDTAIEDMLAAEDLPPVATPPSGDGGDPSSPDGSGSGSSPSPTGDPEPPFSPVDPDVGNNSVSQPPAPPGPPIATRLIDPCAGVAGEHCIFP